MKKLSVVAAVAASVLSLKAADPDLAGCFPSEIKTVGIVMPASILAKEKFDKGVRLLEEAGYRVKKAPRLSFDKRASLEDRVKDFEETWLDPEVDLVLCARGGSGAEDVIKKLDWQKLVSRPNQKVLGFSNITMILNAMLKKGVGHPFSGPSLGQLARCQGDTCDWLCKSLAGNPLPMTQLKALKPGAFSGLPCGGHIALVSVGIRDGWAADARGRVVFLERNNSATVEGIRKELDAIVDSGFLEGAAGIIFGDVTPGAKVSGTDWGNSRDLPPDRLAQARAEIAKVKCAFADKVKCPVYDGYVYGHIPVSHTIDFRREVRVSADGLMTWGPVFSAQSAEGTVKAAWFREDITPAVGTALGGYGPNDISTCVHDVRERRLRRHRPEGRRTGLRGGEAPGRIARHGGPRILHRHPAQPGPLHSEVAEARRRDPVVHVAHAAEHRRTLRPGRHHDGYPVPRVGRRLFRGCAGRAGERTRA